MGINDPEAASNGIYEKLPDVVLREIKKSNYTGEIFVGDQKYGSTKLDQEHLLGQGLVATALKIDGNEGVVVKLFPASKEVPNTKTLFSDAVILSHKLQHPNIAKPEEIGIVRFGNLNVPCTIEERIANDLEEKIKNTPLDTLESIKIIEAISSALQYIYQETGEIVVDISPKNIQQRTDGTWCVSDLEGTAKKGSNKKISSDEIYSAPECKYNPNANEEASEKSMVYSLSLIFWQSLTGKELTKNINIKGLNEYVTREDIPEPIFKIIQAGLRMTDEPEIRNPLDLYKKLIAAYETSQEQS